jgi:hypothetical protein
VPKDVTCIKRFPADPFIKGRLLDLVARYEDDDFKTASTQTPVDLQIESRGTGPEK